MTLLPKLLRALTSVLLLVAALSAHAQEVKLFPIDEGAGDQSWMRFKARLLDALAQRDHKFVLGAIDVRIRNTSERDGIAEFRKLWEPQSADSPLWSELSKLLFLGGVFSKRENGTYEFCAPYVRYKWPDSAAADAGGAIIAGEALMKARPAAGAPTLQTLSYALVKVLDWEVVDEDQDNKQRWVKIQTRAGVGFVPEEQIRSPLEYRACFAKNGAVWRMTGLEVGE
jgi:hypothetical protein